MYGGRMWEWKWCYEIFGSMKGDHTLSWNIVEQYLHMVGGRREFPAPDRILSRTGKILENESKIMWERTNPAWFRPSVDPTCAMEACKWCRYRLRQESVWLWDEMGLHRAVSQLRLMYSRACLSLLEHPGEDSYRIKGDWKLSLEVDRHYITNERWAENPTIKVMWKKH